MIAHNGEINTLRGNNNWMAARQASVSSPKYGADIGKLWPISYEGQSDTACFDNALEFLTMGGYSLPHAMMMMIPEAWAGNPLMNEERRAFYEYNAALMEPWDGPAAIAFTNGRQISARPTAPSARRCIRRTRGAPRSWSGPPRKSSSSSREEANSRRGPTSTAYRTGRRTGDRPQLADVGAVLRRRHRRLARRHPVVIAAQHLAVMRDEVR